MCSSAGIDLAGKHRATVIWALHSWKVAVKPWSFVPFQGPTAVPHTLAFKPPGFGAESPLSSFPLLSLRHFLSSCSPSTLSTRIDSMAAMVSSQSDISLSRATGHANSPFKNFQTHSRHPQRKTLDQHLDPRHGGGAYRDTRNPTKGEILAIFFVCR